MRVCALVLAAVTLVASVTVAAAAPAFAVLGNFVISGLMSIGLGAVLPLASASAIGMAVFGCSKGAKTIIRRLRK